MRGTIAAFVIALSVGACGSTVRDSTDGAGAGPSADGELSVDAGSNGSTAAGSSGTAPTTVGSGSPGGATAAPGAADPAGGGGDLAMGPGVSDTEIRIGLSYVKAADAALGNVGFGGLSLGDTRADLQALIDDLNESGGIRGRQLVPVWYEYDPAGDPATQHQAACAAWTEDDHVFIAGGVTLAFEDENTLVPCLANHDVPWLGGDGDGAWWQQYERYQYAASAIDRSTQFRILVDSLVAQSFFTDDARIGLVRSDRALMDRAVADGLTPALDAQGLAVDEEVTLHDVDAAQVSSAVLRFKSAGITHVLFGFDGGGVQAMFMRAAQSQGYHPRYALSTAETPSALVLLAPPEQLAGSVGYGYRPPYDVDAPHDPGASPGAQPCLARLQARGIDTSSRLAQIIMLQACEALDLLRAGLAQAPALTTDGFGQGVDALGDSLPSAAGFSTSFRPSQHDGAGGYRLLSYDSGCECFVYHGGTVARP